MTTYADLKKFAAALKAEYDARLRSPTQSCKGFICGPDITKQVKAAVQLTRNAFKAWDDDTRAKVAEGLTNLFTGGAAWDIDRLLMQDWILLYRPDCASQGATPACGASVQVGKECYYAGSVNYVIYGAMFRLCYEHFAARGTAVYIPSELGFGTVYEVKNDYTKEAMIGWIEFYKGKYAWTHFDGPGKNLECSKGWAQAGYDGWPEAGTPPPGDRSNCKPCCSSRYTGDDFRVHWHPYVIRSDGQVVPEGHE